MDSLLDRGVDPGVVVLVELVGVGVGVGGPGHAHRPHHVTRDVRGPGSDLITVLTDQYSESHAHHNNVTDDEYYSREPINSDFL